MPNRSIEPAWRDLIITLAVNNPTMGAYRMQKRLEEEAPGLGLDPLDVPSHRTITRVLKEVKAMIEKEREPYQYFRWPESMEAGLLPWEATRAALDLLVHLAEIDTEWPADLDDLSDEEKQEYFLIRRPRTVNVGRPTVRVVRWFWRVTQAIPEATVRERRMMAAYLLLATVIAPKQEEIASIARRAVEWRLAYQPWHSPEYKAVYEAAYQREREPIPGGTFTVNIQDTDASKAIEEGFTGILKGQFQ